MMPMPELEEHAARSSQPQAAPEPDPVALDEEDDDLDDEALPELREEEKTRQVSLASLGPRIEELGEDDDDVTPPDGTPLGALAHGDPDAPIPPLPPPDVAEALAPPRLSNASRAATAPKAPPPARRAETGAQAPGAPVLAPPVIAKPPAPVKPPVLAPPPAAPPPSAAAPTAPTAMPKPASVPPPPKAAAPQPPPPKPAAKPLPPTPVVRSADPPPATAPSGPPSQPTISVSPIASVPEPTKRRGPSLDITSTSRHLPTIRPMRARTISARANARVIGMAVAIAVVILGGSLGFAAFRKYQEESAREQRLRERFERIQSGDAP